MSFFAKYQIPVWILFLACGVMLSPVSYAQIDLFSAASTLNSSGAYLGIQMEDVTADNMSKYKLSNERGVIVSSVIKESPAEKANLKENDVILEFGGFPVWSSLQLSRFVGETPVDRKVEIVASRDGKRMNFSAQLTNRDRRRAENRMEIMPEDSYGRIWRQNPPFNAPNYNLAEPPARKPRLGLSLQALTDQLGEFLGVSNKGGALVVLVAKDSPSAGKIKAGDVIIGVDDKNISSPNDLTQYVRNKEKGSIKLKVIRDKKEMIVAVDLSEAENPKDYKL
jgi:serine protease Do